ncbi:MAG: metal ABC transporter ATP-binding protein [Methanoculleaceae archaeon]
MAEPLVELENVWFSFGHRPVLENISLRIYRTDFMAIIGPNGGGKTTLLKVILGLYRPDSGTVRVLGRTPQQSRHLIGYVPQYRTFDFDFPARVVDVVATGRLGRKRFPLLRFSDEDREAVYRALETMEIADLADRRIGSLSGGEQQRVIIARALAMEPVLLLLDEPTNHIDVTAQSRFYEILHELHRKMPIVMVTHDISVVSVHVDRIACLNRRIYIHDSGEVTGQVISEIYGCPVELIAHGVPHRVLREHTEMEGE